MPPAVVEKSVGAFASLKKPAWKVFVELLNRQMLITALAGVTVAAILDTWVPADEETMTWLQPAVRA
ncbi:MAG: hypothetical protein ACRD1G_04540 [Acidimicrobiales bacterium]